MCIKREKSEGDYGNEEGHQYHTELIWLLQKPKCFRDVLSLLPQPTVPAGSEWQDKVGFGPVWLVSSKHHLQQMMCITIPMVQEGNEQVKHIRSTKLLEDKFNPEVN